MKILLVDDSTDFQDVFAARFRPEHEVVITSTVPTAIGHLQHENYDLIVLDWLLPFQNGRFLLEWISANKPNQKIFINTGLPKEAISRFTNGIRILTKGVDSVVDAVEGETKCESEHGGNGSLKSGGGRI